MLRLTSFLAFVSFISFAAPAYARCGIASYYGPGFHGNSTANGERFNRWGLTAAHRSLPFGTKLRVVNPSNGRSVVVRVNDDGPHVGGRVLDLAEGAFARLGTVDQGLLRVCYQVM